MAEAVFVLFAFLVTQALCAPHERKAFIMQKISVQKMVQVALLVALEVVLSRFVSVGNDFLKISFNFVPVVLAAMLYGPVWGATVAGLGDLLGALLFPRGPFFPGFTLTAVLVGLVYGLFLFRKTSIGRVVSAALIVSIPLGLGLNTLWICILYDLELWAILPGRTFQELFMIFIRVVLIYQVIIPVVYLIQDKIAEKKTA